MVCHNHSVMGQPAWVDLWAVGKEGAAQVMRISNKKRPLCSRRDPGTGAAGIKWQCQAWEGRMEENSKERGVGSGQRMVEHGKWEWEYNTMTVSPRWAVCEVWEGAGSQCRIQWVEAQEEEWMEQQYFGTSGRSREENQEALCHCIARTMDLSYACQGWVLNRLLNNPPATVSRAKITRLHEAEQRNLNTWQPLHSWSSTGKPGATWDITVSPPAKAGTCTQVLFLSLGSSAALLWTGTALKPNLKPSCMGL